MIDWRGLRGAVDGEIAVVVVVVDDDKDVDVIVVDDAVVVSTPVSADAAGVFRVPRRVLGGGGDLTTAAGVIWYSLLSCEVV